MSFAGQTRTRGRDTLSDEHLIGTAAGIMRSRAVRRLQEPARWVPAAMNAMLFTPWSPHLNLLGRPRLQRPAHEEPDEAGTLPRFIEIPPAPTKNPKSETLKSTPGDAEQSTKRRRQEVTFQEPQPTSPSSGTVADTSMQIPDPQIPKPARPLSPAVREDSIQKRQRPAEVNTVLAIAGGDSRIEISTLTDDQKALHTAKQVWCGGGGRQTAVATNSLNTLGIKTEIGWILRGETCGTRI